MWFIVHRRIQVCSLIEGSLVEVLMIWLMLGLFVFEGGNRFPHLATRQTRNPQIRERRYLSTKLVYLTCSGL
jgi:hypothetical protein